MDCHSLRMSQLTLRSGPCYRDWHILGTSQKMKDLIVWIGTVEEQVNCLISTLRLLQETVVERRLELFLFLHVKSFTKCWKVLNECFLLESMYLICNYVQLCTIVDVLVLPPGTIQADPLLSLGWPDSSSCCPFASGARSYLLKISLSYPFSVTFRIWSLGTPPSVAKGPILVIFRTRITCIKTKYGYHMVGGHWLTHDGNKRHFLTFYCDQKP